MVETTGEKQVCRAASTLVYPALDFGIKPCGTYTREDFEQVLSRIAFDHEFANTGGKTIQLERSEPVDVTVFAVPHRTSEDEHVWFVTNLDVESETIKAYAAAFRRRWGIETSYRQIGDFLPRTSSPMFSVRLFYFLFAVALYNLWVLANVLISGGPFPRKPQISTRIFRTLVIPHAYG